MGLIFTIITSNFINKIYSLLIFTLIPTKRKTLILYSSVGIQYNLSESIIVLGSFRIGKVLESLTKRNYRCFFAWHFVHVL